MPLQASRVRRWFAIGAVAMVVIVLGTYYYAKWRVDSTLQQVKEKIGVEIKQSAQGFTISKSVGGRTLFKIQADKAVQYRQGEHAELHEVNITLYGDDSSRFDQIYGQDFEYNPQSGEVSAKGDVQIDLQANPEGLAHADQALPKELKNPIHLKTRGLVFNQKTGNAYTKEKIEFRIPQALGSARGATYEAKSGVLTLQSEVTAEFQGANPARIAADSATITKQPEVVVLQRPRGQSGSERFEAEEVRFFLRPDNTLEHAVATGNVLAESRGRQPLRVGARQLEVKMMEATARVDSARFSGNVQWETLAEPRMKGRSGVMQLSFAGHNFPRKIHTEEAVELSQQQNGSQNLDLTAPGMDLFVIENHLQRAETLGPAKIVMTDIASQQTVATAGRFEAKFNAAGRLVTLHGSPEARIVSGNDRVSTSRNLDVVFAEKGGLQSLTQQGNITYSDGTLQATADQAAYAVIDQTVLLTGSPRLVSGGLTTTADSMKVNRRTGEMFAAGNVKSTYSNLKPQPGGALLASADPIHVTSRSLVAHQESGAAVYTGDVRLWQQANVVEASRVEFDRDRRSLKATGAEAKKVTTTLMQTGSQGQGKPLTILSGSLMYKDDDSKVHFSAGVVGRLDDIVVTAEQMDAFREAPSASNKIAKIDRIVAQNHVVITQPGRKASGEMLTYTASDEKFVLTGGFPSIFDAERGKITGVSLTFFRRDARVLVEGNSASPAVSQTQVAR